MNQAQVVPPLPGAQAPVLPLPAPQLRAGGHLVTHAVAVGADLPEHGQHLQDGSGAEQGPDRDAAELTEQLGPPAGQSESPEGLWSPVLRGLHTCRGLQRGLGFLLQSLHWAGVDGENRSCVVMSVRQTNARTIRAYLIIPPGTQEDSNTTFNV